MFNHFLGNHGLGILWKSKLTLAARSNYACLLTKNLSSLLLGAMELFLEITDHRPFEGLDVTSFPSLQH